MTQPIRIGLLLPLLLASGMVLGTCSSASAQISPGSLNGNSGSVYNAFSQGEGVATLQAQLTNRLRATTIQQQGFIHRVTEYVNVDRLPIGLVLAVQRYAIRKNPVYPFPYFERAMRFEAKKRGVYLPPVALVATTPGEAHSLSRGY